MKQKLIEYAIKEKIEVNAFLNNGRKIWGLVAECNDKGFIIIAENKTNAIDYNDCTIMIGELINE